MWTRLKELWFITHRLCSLVKDDVPCGYQALDWESILHGNAGELGDYSELAILPDKIARFLYEYHSESYLSLQLPQLPDDRSNFDFHGMLIPHQVDLHTIYAQYFKLLPMLLTAYLYLVPYRTDPYRTLCRYYCHLQAEAISFFTTALILVTKNTRESNEFRSGRSGN